MKQITWQGSCVNGERARAMYRNSPTEPWRSIRDHPMAIGKDDFQKFQYLLSLKYEAVS